MNTLYSAELAAIMKKLTEKPFSVSVASVKEGDEQAFLDLYNHLHIKVFHFFLKKSRTNDMARELTQQTFIRLWQFKHTLSDQHTLDKQLFVIAHSVLINHFEKELRRKKINQRQPEQLVYQFEPQTRFELSNRLNTAINSLPPVRKKILTLKTFHDYSNKEIAQQMDISIKTVEDHITRAFRRIKQLIPVILVCFQYFF